MNTEQKLAILEKVKLIVETHEKYLPYVNRTLGMKSPAEMIRIVTDLKNDMIECQKLLEGI
jgi:hypothetical protein